jgi:hypothetical protein
MNTLETISRFEAPLLSAFSKMIKGINVELSEQGKESIKGTCLSGRWFFITAIDCDESISIQDQTHGMMSGLKLTDLKL